MDDLRKKYDAALEACAQIAAEIGMCRSRAYPGPSDFGNIHYRIRNLEIALYDLHQGNQPYPARRYDPTEQEHNPCNN